MKDTSGRTLFDSLPPTSLQSSLENRLRANLAGLGSPVYALTWKHWAISSGRPICALRASARHTLGSDFTGWPAATALDSSGRAYQYAGGDKTKKFLTLAGKARLAIWPTPTASLATKGVRTMDGALREVDRGKGPDLSAVASTASGPTASGSGAATARTGRLNPAFVRWLMGFPKAWCECAPKSIVRRRR